tara:strand:- start:547 stop:3081 length:2535 start_codon:yes stop_codon:yes gene_type:complete
MNKVIPILIFFSFINLYSLDAQGVFKKLINKKEKKEEKKPESKNSINKKTKDCTKYEGLFNLYQSKKDGKSFFEIDISQLDGEYIYFSYVEDGVLDAWKFRGGFRGSKIIKIKKFFNKIDFVIENNNYYFAPSSPLSKASKANINEPLIISEQIIATNDDSTKFLINADKIFLSEAFQQVKSSYPSGYKGFKLGSLSKEKTRYSSIKNYPENTDVIVDYVYENKYPTKRGTSAVTDSRVVTIKIQHSLIRVPDNDFNPRWDDPRVGYFYTQTNDMTSIDQINYRDMIHRWNLQKEDPSKKISDPIKPITWWIENTTPYEFRDIIKKGVEFWNLAFESAGFSNAIEVKIQPDTAEWDAGDIRYNVLRWTSSPNPPFGGYGPSFVNPKTGEILGADIMLEWVYITNRIKYDFLYDIDNSNNYFTDNYCFASHEFQKQNIFGDNCIDLLNLGEEMKKEMVKQSLYRLVLHEVGHTLGLSHNFKGSTLLTNEEVKNKDIVSKKGLCSSVMEYPAINIATLPENQGLFYDTIPGLYDHWAIQFGYSVFEKNEKEELNKILFKSTSPSLAFANDADDMRSPGKGIDPNAMINDLTSDPLEHSIEKMELINSIIPKLKEKYSIDGESYERLKRSYYSLISNYFTCLDIISRQIGGVYVDRSFVGQNTNKKPFSAVSIEDQKKAMETLSKYAFSDEKIMVFDDLYPFLQSQRRGWNFRYSGEDPKILSLVLYGQKRVLAQLLHPNVLSRISNSSFYGNNYDVNTFLKDLTNSIFLSDLSKSVSSARMNLQVQYVKNLISILNKSNYDHLSKAAVYNNLVWLDKNLSVRYGNTQSIEHRKYLIHLIEEINSKK